MRATGVTADGDDGGGAVHFPSPTRYHRPVPTVIALGLLGFELLVLTGGLTWTFRRAQLPVGVLGALGLATVVAVSQAALMAVVEASIRMPAGSSPQQLWAADQVHAASVLVGVLAVAVAAPLALKRYLNLDARWTRALSRELLAGFVASLFAGIVLMGLLVIAAVLIYALSHGH